MPSKKNCLLALVILLCSSASKAALFSPDYFNVVSSSNIQTDALSVYRMKNRSLVGAATDIALLSHSTMTTLIPAFLRARGVAPIPWVLAAGAGGSLSGDAFVNFGLSANATAWAATTVINWTGKSSNKTMSGIADFFTQGLDVPGAGTFGFAGGVGFYGQAVSEGHFQNFAAAFPGRGFAAIAENASCYTLGLTWKIPQ
jgi:hypothetical protein